MNLQNQLSEIIQGIQQLRVESILILGAILLLVVGLVSSRKEVVKSIFGVTIVVAFYFSLGNDSVGMILSRSMVLSDASLLFTTIFLFSGLALLLFQRSQEHAMEFYFFVLSLLVGGVVMMKSNSLLVVFIAVELTSFSGYILTNFSFSKKGHEAGIKYLLFGAMSSAIMLLGFGLLYGSSGVFYLSDLDALQQANLTQNVGILLIVGGLLFKSSIVPFHLWVPATYQEAPSDAAAIISIVPKLAALVLLGRIFDSLNGGNWVLTMTLVLGMLTITFGVFSALRQSHARRMISLGAVAHSGFLLPLAIVSSVVTMEVFWWYAAVYALMNIAIFFFLDEFERKSIVKTEDYAGLSTSFPIAGISMTIVLISLVGLPPLAGFTAKLFLFTSLYEAYALANEGVYLAYLLLAVFATVISLFFYLKIPYQLFLVKPVTSGSVQFSLRTKFIATLFSIVLLLLFFAPQTLTVMQQLLSHIP